MPPTDVTPTHPAMALAFEEWSKSEFVAHCRADGIRESTLVAIFSAGFARGMEYAHLLMTAPAALDQT